MIEGRIFLVGYPRSGTTLLQSLIATQPAIATFPESHFFDRSLNRVRRRRLLRLGMVSWSTQQQLRTQLRHFLCQLGVENGYASPSNCSIWLKDYSAVFVRLLDTITINQGKTIWLEKTPDHLRYIDLIERCVRGAKFIHLVRNGVDAVSSYYAVARQYPVAWSGIRTLDRCLTEWQQAVRLTMRHLGKPTHLLVRYEALVTDPDRVLQQVCDFIGTSFQPALLHHYAEQAARLICPDEQWKARVMQPISNRNGTRFYEIFTEQQRSYIEQALATTQALIEHL